MTELSWGGRYVMVPPEHFRIDYAINPFMDTSVQPDRARVREEYAAIVAAIEAAGGEVVEVEQRPDAPDMVYAMNLGFFVESDRGPGVVLSHMSDADVCGLLPYARIFANRGYQVLVYFFHGYGLSGDAGGTSLDGDVVAAAGYLRAHGAGTIALIGASMGATASVAAATELQPAPAVVISLSAPQAYRGADAIDAVKQLTVPVVYVAGTGDGTFADDARALYDATPATTKRTLLLVPTTAHGVPLIGAPGSRVFDAIDDALRQQAPAQG